MPRSSQQTNVTVKDFASIDEAMSRIRKSLERAFTNPVRGEVEVVMLVGWNEEDAGDGKRHEGTGPA